MRTGKAFHAGYLCTKKSFWIQWGKICVEGVWSIYSVTLPYGERRHDRHWLADRLYSRTVSAAWGVRNISHASSWAQISTFPPKAAQWGENSSDPRVNLKLSQYLWDTELILTTEAHKHTTCSFNTHTYKLHTHKLHDANKCTHMHIKIVFDDYMSGMDFM